MRATSSSVKPLNSSNRSRKKDLKRKRRRNKSNLTANYLATIPKMEEKPLFSSEIKKRIIERKTKFSPLSKSKILQVVNPVFSLVDLHSP